MDPQDPLRIKRIAKTLEPTTENLEVVFRPDVNRLGFIEQATEQEIRNEVMLHRSDPVYAMTHGGPLTSNIVKFLIESPEYRKCEANAAMKAGKIRPIVDTRVQLLFPGMYPEIPGWHCDFVPRMFGQPDLNKLRSRLLKSYRIFSVVISSHQDGVSNPCYIRGTIRGTFTHIHPIWGQLNLQINKLIDENPVSTHIQIDREIIMHTASTIHRTAVAHNKGWMYSFRLALVDLEAQNEIRTQVQVYSDPNIGY